MREINTGGSAFPVTQAADRNGDIFIFAQEGMSLRDYFAAKYMHGMCGSKFYTDGNIMDGELADHAYAMADAMLKAREA